ncbi:hypothetical protein [Leptospira kmetyi]|uniref:hypothetical protein n=1 Tax=Leptospira kmetyi TaxID=408139 RepID=UPI001083EB92|nr:hypothetical protein [Leptospira kmetyi]TGL66537.1 hypothetical protein EHQ67_16110 [Leptospira kmetyi]
MVIVKDLLNKLPESLPVLCLFSSNLSKVYFGIGCSKKIVSWLSEQDFIILGIEGFNCDGVSILPLSDYIADFSSIVGSPQERITESLNSSIRILSLWDNAVEFVEFVVEKI